MRRPRSLSLVAILLVLAVAATREASSQQPPPQPPADAGRVFTDVLTRYYDACARKDLPGVESLWHSQGPARRARNVVEVEFELRSIRLLGLSLRDVSVDSGGGRARAVIELAVTDAKTGQARTEWRVRDFTFLPEAGTWKIWNEGGGSITAARQLATRLLSAPAAERAALLASEPELRTDDALAGLASAAAGMRSSGALAQAVDAMRLRASIARDLGNLPVLAASLQDMGLVYQVQGNQDEAGRAFTEARALYTRFGTRLDVATVDGNLASVDYVRGDYASAVARYRQALDAYEAEKDAPRTASTLHSCGNALYMLGEFDQALAAYQRSLSMHEQAGDRYSASSVLQAIALVHKELGNYATAIESFARSASLSQAVEDLVGAARAEHGLGEVHRLTGDFSLALRHFSASIALWEKTRDAPNLASTLYAAGRVDALQRNFSRAVERYQRALALDEQAGEQAGMARDLGGLGGAHSGLGQMEAALDEYRKSLALREQLHDGPGTMWTMVHIGVLQTALGRHSEALEAYQRALQAAEPAGDAGAVGTILALRAANELAREDVEAAIASAAKAVEIAERTELFDAVAFARTVEGKALRRAGRGDEARAALEAAVGALDRVPTGPSAETFFDDRRGPYVALIDQLLAESRGAEAFRWSERARVRGLALMLGPAGTAVVKGLTADERDEERRLDREGRTLLVRLRRERTREKPDEARLAKIRDEIQRAQAEREALTRRLFAAHPSLAGLRAQVDPAGIEAAGSALAGSEALLSFVVTETRTHVFVLGRDRTSTGAALVKTASIETGSRDLAARVSALREAIVTRGARAQQLSREMYALLIEPVRPNLARARSVVIVPDAFLWTLPFEALQDAGGRYLVQDFAVSYAPSLTALSVVRDGQRRPERSRRFLVAVADPVVSAGAEERLAIVRPSSSRPPAAAREALAVSAVLGRAASRAFVGEQARADRVVPAVRQDGALHLAAPLYLNDASPLHSLLAMPGGSGSAEGDEVVELGEVMGWTVPAEFVTLARTESTAGAGGDSLVALSWVLFVAGSPTTVVTRWMPTTDTGMRVTLPFYRAWAPPAGAARRTPAEALQQAAKNLIARPGSQPADWAGLMVIGR